jgi:hypothetical protein
MSVADLQEEIVEGSSLFGEICGINWSGLMMNRWQSWNQRGEGPVGPVGLKELYN